MPALPASAPTYVSSLTPDSTLSSGPSPLVTANKSYFWRSRAGLEVDFVLYGRDAIYAIEVKNTSRIRPEDLRALREFRKDYPKSRTILLYRGKERILTDDVLCVPCAAFLKELSPRAALPTFD